MTVHDTPSFASMRALIGQLPAASRGAMLRMYRKSLDEHLEQVAAALQPGGEPAASVAAVHRIAGAAGMMQDQALSQVARDMEVALREGRPGDAQALWPELQVRAEATRRELDVIAAAS